MFKKLLSLGCIAGLIILTATGCGKMTAEKLMNKMEKAAEGKTITHYLSEGSLEASYEQTVSWLGVTMSAYISGDSQIETFVSTEPFAVYRDESYVTSYLEDVQEDTASFYTVIEDGEAVTYEYTAWDSEWNRTEHDVSAENAEQVLMNLKMFRKSPENIVLAEETTTIEGKEVYQLELTLLADEAETFLANSYLKESIASSELDFSEFVSSVNMTCYVDTETYLPIQAILHLSGQQEVLDAVIAEWVSQANASEEVEIQNVEEVIFDLSVTILSYDPVEVPELPENAKQSI